MAEDFIRYDILIQDAMRGLVRTVLKDASVRGLLGEHHFFISFDARAPAVKLSPRLRAQYPEEMTIVLQHQFWDLKVSDEGFEVGLSFDGITERLVVPFAAIRRFADPSVNFDIRFAEAGEAEGAAPKENVATRVTGAESAADAKPVARTSETADKGEPEKSGPRGEVVSLDRFRKK